MQFWKRTICSALVLMIFLGLGMYVSPESVSADTYAFRTGHSFVNAASKVNQPALEGDQESVSISYGNKISLTDAVRYINLTVGITYLIEGKLYELTVDETGAKNIRDTGISSSQTFIVPDSPRARASGDGETKVNTGVVSLQFSVDELDNMIGRDYVIFETLKCEDKIIAQLDQVNDSSRHVKTPEFASVLVNSENGTKYSIADTSTSAKAIVSYKNLVPGENYYCHARLIKQGDGGSIFTLAEEKFAFVPTKTNDSIEKILNYTVTPLTGDVVQLLYDISTDGDNNTEALVYKMDDSSFVDNRLYLTGFNLVLNDKKTGTAVSEYSKTATTKVTLNYENLPYGELKVTTSLYDASTNKLLKGSDGKPCRKTEAFYAVMRNSSYSTDFTFDSTSLAGHQLYSTIKISEGNKVIYSADSKTSNNRIYIASVASKILSFDSGAHKANLSAAYQSIKDLISYKNLLSGSKYSVESVLVNAKTKKKVTTSSRSEFTASNSTGEFSNAVGALVYSGLFGSILHSHVNLYMNDVLVASSRSVPKNYSGINIPKPTATPKPTRPPTPKPVKKAAPKKKTKKKKAKKSVTVYWTEYGECYHRRLSCIRRSRYYYKGTLSEAKMYGYRPCKKCYR